MVDVAKLAGVSQTTVSFVLNANPNVSIPEETRERIMAAMAQLGYRPNAFAKGLRSQRTHLIGFITDTIAITPHAGKIFEGAQDAAWEKGKILLLVNTKANRDMEDAAIEMMLGQRVEGIIYATMYHHPVSLPETLREVPTVLLDCFSTDYSYPSVVPDEVCGAKTIMQVLLDKGHRRIGFLNNFDPVPATFGRLQGYREALESYGVPYDPALVFEDYSDSSGGYRTALKVMQTPHPPTAIFCYNDRMAMGAYDALRKLNLRIPDDVAVVGYDNQELIAEHLYPPLTTMELPHYEMGIWAINHLLEVTENPTKTEPVHHKIEPRLIVRASA